MKLLIEGYPYESSPKLNDVLDGLFTLQNVEGKISVRYVGYYFNPKVQDVVYVLPKVILDEKDLAFGKYDPNKIIDLNEPLDVEMEQEHRDFLFSFATWVHRAIVVYKETAQKEGNDTKVIHSRQIELEGKGDKKQANTLLDVILSLIRFNRENKSFFTFVLKNMHSGFNKINWNKTISRSTAVINNGVPVYLNPVNKCRQINFDEELFIIYFSILNHVAEKYGFRTEVPFGFDLIKGDKFTRYIDGYGERRLMEIKYKYFSDVTLRLWNLCMAFFKHTHQLKFGNSQSEYLLVSSFHTVFEAIIDELIGDKDVPKGLQDQEDNKRIDHFYTYKGLIKHEQDDDDANDMYYIGDSKYYPIGSTPGKPSVAKQYTYARNVIQWNLNLFLEHNQDETSDETANRLADKAGRFGKIQLLDPDTEGYNIIPNFFISAEIQPNNLRYDVDTTREVAHNPPLISRQFENRLYDRNTLIISHFDVNFLHVLSLYAQDNAANKAAYKESARKLFRKAIQEILTKHFEFFAMAPKPGEDAQKYFKEHFQQTLGKAFKPFDGEAIYSLALDRDPIYKEDNDKLRAELGKVFDIVQCNIGNPMPSEFFGRHAYAFPTIQKPGVLVLHLHNYMRFATLFHDTGKVAVPISMNEAGLNLMAHAAEVGAVLFYTGSPGGYHLFALREPIRFMAKDTLHEIDHYVLNVGSSNLYAILDIDMDNELPSDHITYQTSFPDSTVNASFFPLTDLITK